MIFEVVEGFSLIRILFNFILLFLLFGFILVKSICLNMSLKLIGQIYLFLLSFFLSFIYFSFREYLSNGELKFLYFLLILFIILFSNFYYVYKIYLNLKLFVGVYLILVYTLLGFALINFYGVTSDYFILFDMFIDTIGFILFYFLFLDFFISWKKKNCTYKI